MSLFPQDGRADVVANDAGDRVTPAVVAFSESEEVRGGQEGGRKGEKICRLLGFFLLLFAFISRSGCWLSCEAEQDKKYFEHCGESEADPWAEVREGGVKGAVRNFSPLRVF